MWGGEEMVEKGFFEDILNKDLRWPQPNDRPFVAVGTSSENTYVAGDYFTRLVLMIAGYKRSADLLVETCVKDPRDSAILVFPIVFNYRHFIELSIKYQLATFGPAVGIEPNWKSHNLKVLWAEFLKMLNCFEGVVQKETEDAVQLIVFEFAENDQGSFLFRYPVDGNGISLPITYPVLYLPTLRDVMNGVSGYFAGCDGYLSDLNNTGL